MWREWINVLLAVFIVLFGIYEAASLWIITAGVLVLVLSFWAAIDWATYEDRRTAHVH